MEKPQFITEGTFIEAAKKQGGGKKQEGVENQIPKSELSEIGQMHYEILSKVLEGYEPGRFRKLEETYPIELFTPLYSERRNAKDEKRFVFADLNEIEEKMLRGKYSMTNVSLGGRINDLFTDKYSGLEETDELNEAAYNLSKTHPGNATEAMKYYKHIKEPFEKFFNVAKKDPVVFEHYLTQARKFLDFMYEYLSSHIKKNKNEKNIPK